MASLPNFKVMLLNKNRYKFITNILQKYTHFNIKDLNFLSIINIDFKYWNKKN